MHRTAVTNSIKPTRIQVGRHHLLQHPDLALRGASKSLIVGKGSKDRLGPTATIQFSGYKKIYLSVQTPSNLRRLYELLRRFGGLEAEYTARSRYPKERTNADQRGRPKLRGMTSSVPKLRNLKGDRWKGRHNQNEDFPKAPQQAPRC